MVADYVECENLSAVARKYNTSAMSVKRIVENDKNTLNMVKAKKAQNDADILAYMDGKTASIKRFLTYVLDERLNPELNREELDRISLPQITTMYGIVVDKAVKAREIGKDAQAGVEIKVEMGPLEDYAG